MVYSRRSVIKSGSLVSLGVALARPEKVFASSVIPVFPDGYPDRKAILDAAVESAIAAGATYADARLSHDELMSVRKDAPFRNENMAFGVRALYRGYWGFASSPIWSTAEASRLGAAAVAQAQANVLGRERITELAPLSDLSSGHWSMPVKDDPFAVDYDEISDFVEGLISYTSKLKFMSSQRTHFVFQRMNKAFSSSLGQHTTQTLYNTRAEISFILRDDEDRTAAGTVERISAAGQGLEYLRDRPVREYIKEAHELALQDLTLPVEPVDVGRFNMLLDQSGVSSLLIDSIGAATEVDRVFGYEANAGGTSYIADPESMLGTLKIGSSLLNVSGDRSQPGSVGRVQWDDEGVTPEKYDIIRAGTLVDLQTNREGATWIKDYYQSNGAAVRSSGSAFAPSALDVPMVHNSDLTLHPSASGETHDSLREQLGDGIEFRLPKVTFDFQKATGMLRGSAYKVRNGKRISRISDAGAIFRTSELWSNLTALGGQDSVRYSGIESVKGQPEQTAYTAVYCPPATFKDMTVIDVKRKG